MVKNEKVSIIVDLIARALGVDYTNPEHVATLTGYLDLYADAVCAPSKGYLGPVPVFGVNDAASPAIKRVSSVLAELAGNVVTDTAAGETEPFAADLPEVGPAAPEFAPEPAPSPEGAVAPVVNDKSPPAAEKASKKATRSQFAGPGGAEKKALYERLRQYRIQSGPGCYERLEKSSGGTATADELREMFNAMPFPIEKWRAVGAALDAIEQAN